MERKSKKMLTVAILLTAAVAGSTFAGEKSGQPYRLPRLYNYHAKIFWDSECREPQGQGLAFGGSHSDADDGRPHTRVLEGDAWKAIHAELRAKNLLQKLHDRTWKLRCEVKDIRARARFIYFKGWSAADESAFIKKEIDPRLEILAKDIETLTAELDKAGNSKYEKSQAAFAKKLLAAVKPMISAMGESVTADRIKALHKAQLSIALAAEALDAEPPARALSPVTYDAKTKQYVLFGGDHLDYITNDTWVFDPAEKKWFQRHPAGAPAPRGNHKLIASGDGKVKLRGGYRYSSSTAYMSGQYVDIGDGEWIYDVEGNVWTGTDKLVAPMSREYRTGPFHPDFYLKGEKPNAAAWETKLATLPTNQWVTANPPYRPQLSREWGTARIDPDRDMILRWSGGHSCHGGSDVPHYHFGVNRWELPFPVEFPLGCLYHASAYPDGYNLNKRPWMTCHTYNNYSYDPPSRKMVQVGRPRHFYVYDPDVGDWVGRGRKPGAMSYRAGWFTLNTVSTPQGALCWDMNGRVHLFDYKANAWKPLKLSGDKLPGAVVDNSNLVYDSKRGRVLIITRGWRQSFSGQVYAVDPKSGMVKALTPKNMAGAAQIRGITRGCYDPVNDLFLVSTALPGGKTKQVPAYDCSGNRWVSLDLINQIQYGHGTGVMYDPKRNLIWATDIGSQVYVLKLDAKTANLQDLKAPKSGKGDASKK